MHCIMHRLATGPNLLPLSIGASRGVQCSDDHSVSGPEQPKHVHRNHSSRCVKNPSLICCEDKGWGRGESGAGKFFT